MQSLAKERLRPIERVILRLHGNDVPIPEIAVMVGKRPGTVDRIIRMVEFKQGRSYHQASDKVGLRPVEKVVLRLRAQGENYGEIGHRLGRSGSQVRRIEAYARFKTS